MFRWRNGIIAAGAASLALGCSADMKAPDGGMGKGGPSANTGSGGTTGGNKPGNTGGSSSGNTGTSGSSGNTGSSGTNGSSGSSGSSSTGNNGVIDTNCTEGVVATSQIPRLTNEEYDRTVRDLLGVETLVDPAGSAPSNLLAADQSGGLTDIGWAAYKTVGEKIAQQVMADPTLKSKFITCDPAAANCLHDTAVAFGRKAFRRPMSQEEIAEFDSIIMQGPDITPTGAPAEIAETVLYMFLISPGFLQREELQETMDSAGHYTLSGYEIASRLSYTLWGSAPDDTLAKAADDQQLSTPQQILAQAQRMVTDQRTRDMAQSFHRYYMLMGLNTRWDNTNKDSTKFPGFTRDLVPQIQQETEMFFDDIVFAKKGSFNDLLTSTEGFVSAATAPFYGLDPSKFGAGLSVATLDASRAGFLTRLGFLQAYSGYSSTSPILRGAFVSKQVLGIAIPAPPPGAEKTPLPAASDDLNTNRKRYEALTAGDQCVGCHAPYVNPPGFALEAFNTVGSWQTVEADSQAPIDTTATIALDDQGTSVDVKGPADLMAAIATAPGAKIQYASKWVSYAFQREGVAEDQCNVMQLASRMTSSGYSVLNLMADLTQTLSFRVRTVGQ